MNSEYKPICSLAYGYRFSEEVALLFDLLNAKAKTRMVLFLYCQVYFSLTGFPFWSCILSGNPD